MMIILLDNTLDKPSLREIQLALMVTLAYA